MKVVWKFPLHLSAGESASRVMPKGSALVRFAIQDDVPTLWCLCDPEAPKEDRYFIVVGTGHPLPEDCKYIGSTDHGPFVWHAFELGSSNG
jgi:hypothetical protein